MIFKTSQRTLYIYEDGLKNYKMTLVPVFNAFNTI